MTNRIALLACFLLSTVSAVALEAGFGSADITPDVKAYRVPMAGYGARLGRPATGVHDPLRAKVLYLRDGDVSMVLITCDLRSSTPEFKRQIVEKSTALGFTLDNVFVVASHTHDGPSMYPEKFWQMQFGVYDPRIVDIMSSAVAQAVKEAVEKARPAKVGFAEEKLDEFTRNRRWDDDKEARVAAGETPAVDPVLWVMRVDSDDGAPLGLLVNFAVHPTLLGHENMLLSAEWPGVLQRELEQTFPGATALFTNGCEGDQSPNGAQGADDFEKVEDYGRRLAEKAAGIARGISTQSSATIAFRRTTPPLPEFAFPGDAEKTYAKFLDAALEGLPKKAELQVFQIGEVLLVGLPGEPLLEIGQDIQAQLASEGFRKAVSIGLANDYIGYIVNEKEYAHGGYEVNSRSYYGPGLGSFLAGQVREMARTIRSK